MTTAAFRLLLCLLLLGSSACHTVKHVKCNETDPIRNLPWLRDIVAGLEKNKADNNDAEIYRYMYYNRPVFYIYNRCCDVPNELFDCNGQKICEPDGGITGRGDGRCKDFFEKREDGSMLWPVKDKKL